ncbi:universal stress protein [Mycobacterium sp. 1465703.0]|uniref:universal stress protein n=1 Tax=Mycobacterium sp. 1465703.0 TaxID=1834078 RepID=UPI0007FD6D24|nr:universal stress protein [Mycobacterium sp. 1465703.0]OBJ09163.1 universal stress protein [Mycobacterium sp. 1465703.0]
MSNVYSAPAILVGVDGSRAAIHAAVWAIAEAVSRDIPLRLVYVVDPHDASGAPSGSARLAVARAALGDAHRCVEAVKQPVKVETEILWGRTVSKLLEESRSAVMMCIGHIGLNHACHGGPAVATSLVRLALCPVAVIQQSASRASAPAQVTSVVAEVDNGTVLRHAFDEARRRRTPLRAVSVSSDADARDGSPEKASAQAQLDRRLARWMRLYPDVQAEPAIVAGGVDRYLRAHDDPGQLLVTDNYQAEALCHAGHSVLAIRCGNL